MRKAVLFSIAAGVMFGASGLASAQTSPVGQNLDGTVTDYKNIMAANRDQDASYNTLSARGVKTTDKDRENARSKHASAVPATAADIKGGAQVRDVKGVPIGTIAALGTNEMTSDSDQIVIDTGHGKIGVPLAAFGKDDKGLLLSITAQKFNELMAQANAQASAAPAK